MQHVRSLPPKPGCRPAWRLAALGAAALASSCATGVDVTDEELAEICATSGAACDGVPSGGGNANGGTTASNGGTGFGSGGTSGSGGTTASNGGTFGSGGTGFGQGGTFGAGGTGNNPAPPLAEGECLDASADQVVVIYSDRAEGSANQASFVLSVQNSGPSFNLTELTMRYWFTDDGVAEFTGCTDCGNIDYAAQAGGQGLSGVTVTFGEEFGSNYGEIGFGSGGPVGPEGVETVQVRIHASGYQPLNQANDFSFSANAIDAPNRNITPYVNGMQVGGCVPIPP
jgi:hypothetical protein